jgi:hypothetical protein
MVSRRLPSVLAFALLAVSALAPAHAEFGDVPDRFRIIIGGTSADFVTQGALTYEPAGSGVMINFEDLFDIPVSEEDLRLEGFWRMTERAYLDFGFVEFNRTGSKELVQDVVWGEYTLAEGSFVAATWNSRFPYAAYRYDFLHEDKVKISGSAGISYVRIAPMLEADGGVTGPSGPVTGHFEKGESIEFPVPLLGLRIDWAIVNRLELQTYVRLFYLSYEDVLKGGMRESTMRLQWHFTKHVGAAVGYDSTIVRLKEYDTGDYDAKFSYDISGFSAYLTFAF